MFDLASIMKVPGLPTLISLVLGFGIACIFRPLCKGPECIILRGPPVGEIRGAVYQFGTKCVEFEAKPVECPKSVTVPVVDTMSFAELSP
jgi:hypothetical protein